MDISLEDFRFIVILVNLLFSNRGSKDNITVIVVTLNWVARPNLEPVESNSCSSEGDPTGESEHGGDKTPASESS